MAEQIFPHNSQNSLLPAKVMFHINLVSYLQENFEEEMMQMLSSQTRSPCYGKTKGDVALERNIMQIIEYADLKHFLFDSCDSVPSHQLGIWFVEAASVLFPTQQNYLLRKKIICVVRACTDKKKCFRALIYKPRTNGCK